jgi:tetratricopeptide (TPR) repeat protein
MSTLNPAQGVSRRQELREDQVVTFYAKAWGYYEQHKRLLLGMLIGVLAVVALAVGYVFWQQQQSRKAGQQMIEALRLFENGSFRAALNGTDAAPGLLALADDFGGTTTGNLLHFYAADALFRLGAYDSALVHFRKFDAGKNLIGASALAGEAAIYEQQGEFGRAGDLFRQAALIFENEVTTPGYLQSAGRNYEQAGQYDKAEVVYEQLKEDYKDTTEGQNVDAFLARIEAARNAG